MGYTQIQGKRKIEKSISLDIFSFRNYIIQQS